MGEGFGVNEASPQPPFLCFRAEGACPGEPAHPGELTLHFFTRILCKILTILRVCACFILIPRITNKLGIFNYDLREIDE